MVFVILVVFFFVCIKIFICDFLFLLNLCIFCKCVELGFKSMIFECDGLVVVGWNLDENVLCFVRFICCNSLDLCIDLFNVVWDGF